MNNPILLKIQNFGQKVGSNKFVSALQSAMMSCMAIIMIGALSTIICNLACLLGYFSAQDQIYAILYKPYDVTMNLIGLYTTLMIGYYYSKNLECRSPLHVAIDTGVAFLLATLSYVTPGGKDVNITYLGSEGLFIGFVIAWWSCKAHQFCEKKKIKMILPEVCPPSLVNSMSAIIPLLVTLLPIILIDNGIFILTGGIYNLCSGFMNLISVPLSALTSIPGMFVLNLIACILWCFGIHGTIILLSFLLPLIYEAHAVNADIYAQIINLGGSAIDASNALQFFPVYLFSAIAIAGGTGNTLPICIYGLLFGKSEQVKAVSKVGLVPGWFGINEPVTFGMPIMYNPILCIPYVLNCEVVTLFMYLAYKFNFIYSAHIYTGALLPMGLADVIGTLRWQQFFFPYICLLVSSAVWLPFIRMYDKQLYEAEQATLKNQGN